MQPNPRSRRDWLHAALALAGGSACGPLLAQPRYAQKPIRLVVPFAPGGAIDAMSRPVAEALGRELGQVVLVENKAGAAGNIGAALVAKAAPDGYTLLVGTSATHGANPSLFARLPYDALADFEFISLWGSVPNVLVVNAESGAKTVDELIARARREPGKLTYGSAGTGTSLHLAGVLFEKAAGVELTHVAYKGGAPASMDLMGGNIAMMFDTVSVSLPNLKAGKLRALAVAAPERHFALPDVPTFAELGLKNVEAATWAGVFAPKGTPAPVLEELRAAHVKVLADKKVQDALRANGVQLMPWQGERFRGFVQAETRRWAQVVKDAKIAPE
ncbi:MAG: tripartite tricarboxylate transporter substrate binding protein [Ramlibacter sp.]|nr:tripartite tricarboxylate transporter substrate binding protein [Ramlibacter sp.]MDB5915408.1 tripartite tricarboxylate transporter substrate binding protein [Ramlibacter sp.]